MYMQGSANEYRCSMGGTPPMVTVGDRVFATTALDDLVRADYAEHLSRGIFVLTNAGVMEAEFLSRLHAL